MHVDQFIQLFVATSGSVYRDDIKAFIAARWRSFRQARTKDLKTLTRRQLGPYDQKHSQPDPVFRESFNTLLAAVVLLLLTPLLKEYPWALWLFRAVYYVIALRLLLVLTILVGYRAKLLPRVLAQTRFGHVE